MANDRLFFQPVTRSMRSAWSAACAVSRIVISSDGHHKGGRCNCCSRRHGDTAVAHLHFQVNAAPDPFVDKNLPLEFFDIEWAGATRDRGHFIEPAP